MERREGGQELKGRENGRVEREREGEDGIGEGGGKWK